MSGKWRQLSVIFAGLALGSGCANNSGSLVADLERHDAKVELTEVPFHTQVTDQCGPAALATILNSAGIPVSPEELRSRVYIPDRQGSLQLEILAATRHYGRIPYTIDPDLIALIEELESGRPVLVLQNLGATFMPTWHYAVVVGYLPDDQRFVLRSGDRQRHLMSSRLFARSWQRADYWGIVALRPGTMPANVTPDKYLRSVAAIEATGDTETAVASYRVATEQWPQNELAWLGLGNASYAEGELNTARAAYQMTLQLRPKDAITLNNLSQVYTDMGCRDDALLTIESALSAVDDSDPVYGYLRQTQEEAKRSSSAMRCPW